MDLVQWKAYYFDGEKGETIREEKIPLDMIEECKEKKLELLGCLAEGGDEQMEEHFLEENIDVPTDELKASIRKNTLSLDFCPVFLGSAYKNKGVQSMMNGIIDYLPNPK